MSCLTIEPIESSLFVCLPLFIFQYRIGQLYMISKHSHEQSERGEGVEVVQNEPYEDPQHGSGQFTEKRIYLNKWVRLSKKNVTYVHLWLVAMFINAWS